MTIEEILKPIDFEAWEKWKKEQAGKGRPSSPRRAAREETATPRAAGMSRGFDSRRLHENGFSRRSA